MPPMLKYKFIHLALFVFCALGIVYSCKKTDFSHNKPKSGKSFFDLSPNAPSVIKKTVAEFERQNKITGFVKDLVAQNGMPLWDKSIININNRKNVPTGRIEDDGSFEIGDTLVFTPIVEQDSLFVNGFFMSKITGDSVELHLFRGNDYDNYTRGRLNSNSLTAERITLQLMNLNNAVFGYNEFIITDSLLFADDTGIDSNLVYRTAKLRSDQQNGFAGSNTNTNNFLVSVIEICNWGSCPPVARNNGVSGNITMPGGGGTPSCRTCWTVTILNDFPDGSPNPTAGGEGGGMGTPPANGNCTGTTNCRESSRILEGRFPCGDCGPGPIIVIPEEPSHEDDVAWLYQNLLDTTTNPCIDSTLATLRLMDTTIPKLIRSFFGESPAFKMVIGTEYYDTWDILGNNAYGAPRGGKTIDNTMNDTFVVKINTYYNKATDLATAATIIHEAVHCQLLNWFRHMILLNDTVKATQVAKDFGWVFTKEISGYNPAYHNIILINPPTEHHHVMADHFIALMARALENFGHKKGINAPYSYYEKLAWSGLLDSRAFKALSTNRRLAIEEVINAEKDPNSSLLNPYTNQPINYENITPKGRRCP